MTLAGGKAEDLHLREFIDAGFALLVEAHKDFPGGSLMQALEHTAEWREGGDREEVQEISEGAKNEAALKQLSAMMKGVK